MREHTQEMRSKVRLHLNVGKTKAMSYGMVCTTQLKSRSRRFIKWANDFRYLGSCIIKSSQDIKVRKALVWKA